jgi:UDP-glucose 4-epimerase
MEAMRDVGVRRVVLASSGAVYGDAGEAPLIETAAPSPRSPYAVSKIAAEFYVRTIGLLWGMETLSLRIFNAYGPGQHLPASHPPVVPYFLRQALRGGSLVVHGDGSQTRDYVYVDDVVSAMVAASTAPGVSGLVINVGSGVETSVRDLVKLVLEVTGAKPEVLYNAQSSGGVSRMAADVRASREKLNFAPSIKLEDGLRLTLQRDPRFQPG